MKLEFKFVDKKTIHIIAINGKKKHEVGRIFTPSGSAEDTENAIQICGFSEAFDLWGCALFAKPKTDQSGLFECDKNGEKIYEQVKDIQLNFEWETINKIVHDRLKVNVPHFVECMKEESNFPHRTKFFKTTKEIDICYGCFNYPCTCEQKGFKGRNPYVLKRGQDLMLQTKKKDVRKQ